MLDFNDIPKRQSYTKLIFTDVNSTAASLMGQFWVKPRGITFVHILCVAGGGGGAGGTFAATGNFGGGGGGGGSAFSVILVPAYQIPDKLNIRIGLGGVGGAVGSAGQAGGTTKVKFGHIGVTNSALANDNIDVICQVNGASGGSIGTTLAGGAGAFGGNFSGSTGSGPLWLSSIGTTGFGHPAASGGFTGVGGNITINSSGIGYGQQWSFCIGGCGGGGLPPLTSDVGNAGGGYVNREDDGRTFANTPGGAGGSTASASGSPGQNGFTAGLESLSFSNGSEDYKYYLGGTGGGSSGGTTGTGGRGGSGYMGSGGGGGGTGRGAGSIGGTGGAGFCIITTW